MTDRHADPTPPSDGEHGLDATFAAVDRELASDLCRAIDGSGLELVYEPVTALGTGAMLGAETRLRWRHPRRGLLLSEELLPLAERTGLSMPLGEWLVETTCRRLAFWRRTGAVDPRFWLSLHLSPRQLADPGIALRLADCLSQSGCGRGSLVLELTERWPGPRAGTGARLEQLGVRLAVEGFGAGCSSIGLLRELTPELIKIDRSLVRGLPGSESDAKLVRAVLVLGEAFGSFVVAEGVETREQAECLRAMGCQLAQGFYLSSPLTEAELLARSLAAEAA